MDFFFICDVRQLNFRLYNKYLRRALNVQFSHQRSLAFQGRKVSNK